MTMTARIQTLQFASREMKRKHNLGGSPSQFLLPSWNGTPSLSQTGCSCLSSAEGFIAASTRS